MKPPRCVTLIPLFVILGFVFVILSEAKNLVVATGHCK